MSHADHEWAKEQIPAHLAGGLSADERARLEAHAAGCAECIAELDAQRRFDRSMEDLFVPVRPGPELEERVIRAVRVAPLPRVTTNAARVGLAIAAVALLGVVGYVVESEGNPFQLIDGVASSPPKPQGGAYLDEVRASLASANEMADRSGSEALIDNLKQSSKAYEQDAAPNRPLAERESVNGMALTGANFFADAPSGSPPKAAPPASVPVAGDSLDAGLAYKDKDYVHSVHSMLGEGSRGRANQEHGRDEAQQKGQYQVYRAEANAAPASKNSYFEPGKVMQGKELTLEDDRKAPDLAKRDAAAKPVAERMSREQEKTAEQQPQMQRRIIRSGEMEFEIEAFDSTVATIVKIAAEEGGFVATVNSEKLPNGKVRGSVILRVPPDRLDTLILKLRALGELKTQRLGSQDITKAYTDLESRLRAARAMEERLLKIIKDGTGQIKDLLAAEKELGEWRTRIEQSEGEIRYYNNLVSLSTLTITLSEKEIRSPFGITETEKVQIGLEVEDVEKAHKEALAAVADAKGRVTKSELKQHAAGQYNAVVNFEVAPDAAGPLRDRLKQLGNAARLDVERIQQTEGGSGKVGDIKVKRNDTQIFLSIYNLANVAPRETVQMNLACADAEAAYKAILARVEKALGRVVNSSLNRQKAEQTSGFVNFEVKSADAAAVEADVRLAGEVMRMQVVENPDAQNVTKSKRGFQVTLLALGMVQPRESSTVQLASRDVAAGYRAIQEALGKVGARIFSSQLNERDRHNVTANLDFEVKREHLAEVEAAMKGVGDLYSRQATRAQDTENVVDTKTRVQLTLLNLAAIPPKEMQTIAIEVRDVEGSVEAVAQGVGEVKGRMVDRQVSRRRDGQNVGKVVFDVPMGALTGFSEKVRKLGTVRVFEASKNPNVPDSELSVARLSVTLSDAELIMPSDSGPSAHLRKGLSVLAWSLNMIILGICVIGPWVLLFWGGFKLYRRLRPRPAV